MMVGVAERPRRTGLARGPARCRHRGNRPGCRTRPPGQRRLGPAPEVAYWRWQAGVHESIAGHDTSPRRLQVTGHAREAAEQWAALGYPYEAALAMADSGDEQPLRKALADLRSLGPPPRRPIVARRLRQQGARGIPRGPRASTATNPARLTKRQAEVLALVAQGLRDADIAERLYLSEKTAGHHVSAILRKLNVRTRGQAAAEAGTGLRPDRRAAGAKVGAPGPAGAVRPRRVRRGQAGAGSACPALPAVPACRGACRGSGSGAVRGRLQAPA